MKTFSLLTLFLAICAFSENLSKSNLEINSSEITKNIAEINASSVNIRAAANTNSEILCQLTRGEKIIVISIENDWAKIEAPINARVWVEASAIDHGKVVKDAKVFAGPSSVYDEVGRLKIGQHIKIILGSEKWTRIEPNELIYAWVSTRFIKIIEDIPTVPQPKNEIKITEQLLLADKKNTSEDVEGEKLLDFPNKEVIANLDTRDKEYYLEQKLAADSGFQLITGTISDLKEQVKDLATHAIGIRINEQYYTICYLRGAEGIKIEEFVDKKVSLQGKTEQVTGWKRPILIVEKIHEIKDIPKLTLEKGVNKNQSIIEEDAKAGEIIANDEDVKSAKEN